jgi:hypothetical protein
VCDAARAQIDERFLVRVLQVLRAFDPDVARDAKASGSAPPPPPPPPPPRPLCI